jgi:amidohydrolase
MFDNSEFKGRVQKEVDAYRDKLISISQAIHTHPELGLKEFKACERLTSEIESFGFQVDHPVAGLDTAFIARFEGQKQGARVAFVAEYDALPGLGHGCGHNIIAAAAFGAAIALRRVVSELGGTIMLYGTPDEEAIDVRSRGGKVIMAEAGLFEGVDAALMMHPTSGMSTAWSYSFPLKDFNVRFVGKPAHYTVPHKGINALESLLMFLNNVNTLKRGWKPNVMFAYTITDGGGPSAIIVPDRAEAHITMKAFYSEYLEGLYEKVVTCATNVAAMTGAKVEIEVLGEYKNMVPNLHLALSLYANMRALGMAVEDPGFSQRRLEQLSYPGISTDFGDVSWVVPGIHGFSSIGDNDLVEHTPEFARAAGSKRGHEAAILSAKALAMTAVDILTDARFAGKMKEEFQAYRSGGFLEVPGLPPHYLPLPEEFNRKL